MKTYDRPFYFISQKQKRSERGLSLVELLVALGIFTLAGLVIYHVLTISLHLQSKNLSVNLNVHRGKTAYQTIAASLREAVSVPRLINERRENITGNGPAAGFSMHRRVGGPFLLSDDTSATSPNVRISSGAYTPEVGDWLIIPAYGIEKRISGVTLVSSSSGVRQLQLTSNLGETIQIANPPYSDLKVVVYITRLGQYVVEGDRLLFYPRDLDSFFNVVVRNVTTPTPFSLPTSLAATRQILISLSCEEGALASLDGLFRRDGLILSTRAAGRSQLTRGR